jgi:hypothetical protein
MSERTLETELRAMARKLVGLRKRFAGIPLGLSLRWRLRW